MSIVVLKLPDVKSDGSQIWLSQSRGSPETRLKCAILHVVLLGFLVINASNFTEEDHFYLFVKEL